jgi:hypothetical protein
MLSSQKKRKRSMHANERLPMQRLLRLEMSNKRSSRTKLRVIMAYFILLDNFGIKI